MKKLLKNSEIILTDPLRLIELQTPVEDMIDNVGLSGINLCEI